MQLKIIECTKRDLGDNYGQESKELATDIYEILDLKREVDDIFYSSSPDEEEFGIKMDRLQRELLKFIWSQMVMIGDDSKNITDICVVHKIADDMHSYVFDGLELAGENGLLTSPILEIWEDNSVASPPYTSKEFDPISLFTTYADSTYNLIRSIGAPAVVNSWKHQSLGDQGSIDFYFKENDVKHEGDCAVELQLKRVV